MQMNNAAIGGFMAGMALFVLAVIALAVLAFIFWMLMLIDCAKRNFKNDREKIILVIVIALLLSIVAAVYYFSVNFLEGFIFSANSTFICK